VAVDPNARIGRKDIFAGSRVTILGTGLYAGETAVVARMISGGIPAALVRTEAGGMRRVRTIDLQPVASRKPEAPAAERAADLEPAG
jgi:hypothetical protein